MEGCLAINKADKSVFILSLSMITYKYSTQLLTEHVNDV